MKNMTTFLTILAAALLAVQGSATAAGAVVNDSNDQHDKLSFDDWLKLHPSRAKHYHDAAQQRTSLSADDDFLAQRRLIWSANAEQVRAHNRAFDKGYTSYAMTMNSPFADLTSEEFRSQHLMEDQDCSACHHKSSGTLLSPEKRAKQQFIQEEANNYNNNCNHDKDNRNLGYAQMCHPRVDWRTRGIITPIKNQGHCGSCWTFSTTGALEAHTCLAQGRDCTHWTGFAEQQLVDCAGDYNNHGCDGGLPSHAFEYIKEVGGLDLEPDYPYHANETGSCKAKFASHRGKVAEVYNITKYDEDDLVYAIQTLGPVSIAYQVSPDFRFYSHGVYDSFNATTNQTMCQSGTNDVNHAVVAVGLDTTASGVPFYIVRNSWGTSFGMEGYFWMKRGENLCGVSDCASFPLVPVVTDNEKEEEEEEEGTTRNNLLRAQTTGMRGRIQEEPCTD